MEIGILAFLIIVCASTVIFETALEHRAKSEDVIKNTAPGTAIPIGGR